MMPFAESCGFFPSQRTFGLWDTGFTQLVTLRRQKPAARAPRAAPHMYCRPEHKATIVWKRPFASILIHKAPTCWRRISENYGNFIVLYCILDKRYRSIKG